MKKIAIPIIAFSVLLWSTPDEMKETGDSCTTITVGREASTDGRIRWTV